MIPFGAILLSTVIESQRRRDTEEWERIRRMNEEREQNDEDEDQGLSGLRRGSRNDY